MNATDRNSILFKIEKLQIVASKDCFVSTLISYSTEGAQGHRKFTKSYITLNSAILPKKDNRQNKEEIEMELLYPK